MIHIFSAAVYTLQHTVSEGEKLLTYLSLKNSAKSLLATSPYFILWYRTSNPLFFSPWNGDRSDYVKKKHSRFKHVLLHHSRFSIKFCEPLFQFHTSKALLHQLRNYQIFNETPENEGTKYESTDRQPDTVVSKCGIR